eukprot:scaffold7939_cov120-Chaetoceros_neogracile.AAC.1
MFVWKLPNTCWRVEKRHTFTWIPWDVIVFWTGVEQVNCSGSNEDPRRREDAVVAAAFCVLE